MKRYFILFRVAILLILIFSSTPDTFKDEQLRYPRVRKAYSDKESDMKALLKAKQIK